MVEKNKMEKLSFENGIERLEEIINCLDQNSISLEKALELFEEGIQLVKYCNNLLDSAEKKMQILLEDSNGELITEELIITEEG